MNISGELLISIIGAIIIPLLGGMCLTLWHVKSLLGLIQATLEAFQSTLQKADRSLDHNRNEHTKMIALIEAHEKAFNQRMDLLEERIRHERED